MCKLTECAGEITRHSDLLSTGHGFVCLGFFLLGGNGKICRPRYKQANRCQPYYSFHFFSPFLNNI
jgi:hypothetical protein